MDAQFVGGLMGQERLADFVEFTVSVQLDEPFTDAQIADLADGIMSVACGGCLECGDGSHCGNPEHGCKRVVVMGQEVHWAGEPWPEDVEG